MDYRTALNVLLDRFQYKEDVSRKKVRTFLDELLQIKAKDTVQKYTIAYRGLWKHNGWPTEEYMWSLSGMDSGIKPVRVRPFTDANYEHLMGAMRDRGNRRLWLASKIAAFTGAALSGVCRMELRDFDTGKPSLYLPETKKEWRTRTIPCHEAIMADAKEWALKPLAQQSVTNQFSELKKELGYGREHRYHSFRHSVANRLENARVSDREIKRLLGHAIGSVSFDTYSSEGLGYDVLADVVGKITWPDLVWR